MASIVNITAYRFVDLPTSELIQLRAKFKDQTVCLKLKGTILLSNEGINLFLAGTSENICIFKEMIDQIEKFKGLTYKESLSSDYPFNKMFVKIKKSIISFIDQKIDTQNLAYSYIEPVVFKKWLDEQKDIFLLDIRNTYEIAFGSFLNAKHLNINNFKHFPEAVKNLLKDLKDKAIVMFCTGGIRCEKATAFLLQKEMKNVYQLYGGILNYFEKCGSTHYQGTCFVFDQRIAINSELKAINKSMC